MQRQHGGLHLGVGGVRRRPGPAPACAASTVSGPQRPAPPQLLQPGAALGIVGGQFLVQRPGQQTQRIPQPHMVAGQITGGRRQVVGGHRGQAVLPPPLRPQRRPAAVELELEPEDRGAENAALPQVVAHPRLDGAEVLADHTAPGPAWPPAPGCRPAPRGRTAGTCPRSGRALRDPPQPEQPDDVVDPHPAGRPQHGRDHVPERRVGQLGQPVRPPRRLRPVLTVLVERVRWRTDRDPAGEDVLQRPGIRPLRMHPDGQVVHHAQRHPGPGRGCLGGATAARPAPTAATGGSRPRRRSRRGTPATAGDAGCRSSVGHSCQSGPVHLEQRAPGRVVVQTPALPRSGRPGRRSPGRRCAAPGESARAPCVSRPRRCPGRSGPGRPARHGTVSAERLRRCAGPPASRSAYSGIRSTRR